MMTPKRIAGIALAGVILLGLGLWISQRHREANDGDTDTRPLVLPDLRANLNAVSRIRLSKGDGTHATLARGPSGWQVEERGWAADAGQVRKLLLDLSDLRVEEEKTSDPSKYAQLGVEDVSSAKAPGTQVELTQPSSTVKLIVGNPAGSSGSYVRLAGRPTSLLASPQLTPEADARRWLDHNLADLPAEQITAVEVNPDSGPAYSITARQQETPAAGPATAASQPAASAPVAPPAEPEFSLTTVPHGRAVQPGAAAGVAGALAALTLDDVRPAGTAAPAAHATFHTRDGLEVTVAGLKDGDKRYFRLTATTTSPKAQALAQQLATRFAGHEFEVPSWKYDAVFKPLEQLLLPPETPKAKDGKIGARKSPQPSGDSH